MYFRFYFYDGTGSKGPILREAGGGREFQIPPGCKALDREKFVQEAFTAVKANHREQLFAFSSTIGCIAVEALNNSPTQPPKLVWVHLPLDYQLEVAAKDRA